MEMALQMLKVLGGVQERDGTYRNRMHCCAFIGGLSRNVTERIESVATFCISIEGYPGA